ncbi:hypothetical protein JZ751_004022 [Albula glossodonta]|uniref:Methyltransferase-like protein 4 n=1 Tax=Albula glossodonta TaxID=121402 RepID=A0A8T2P3I9_9TELE|nr:hypothetical protein JZ751_004022 [Albula glossodonta]
MSIVFSNSHGWLLDQRAYIDQSYQHCLEHGKTDGIGPLKCCFKKHYFDIVKPHILKSNTADNNICCRPVTAGNRNEVVPNLQTKDKESKPCMGKKKRKRKHMELNQGEIDLQVYHEKVRTVILEGIAVIIEEGLSCGFFIRAENERKLEIPIDNSCLADLCDMAKQLPLVDDSEQKPLQVIDGNGEPIDLFTRVTEHPGKQAREVSLMGERYLLPPHCSFLLSDITRMQPLVSYGKMFDAIVLDPPWENKSVKRSNRYSFLPSLQLKQLPLPLLSAQGCIVATWVTNRQKHLRFVRDELYPHWGVEVLAEWLWVKVTRSGEFVFPMDSPHKKPYEILVLGRYRGNRTHPFSPAETSETCLAELRLIVSVPSVIHSHKPPLAEVLKEYLGPDAKCLELFARNLQPGWTSWGNEVIKFQHLSYFDVEPASWPDSRLSPPPACSQSPALKPALMKTNEVQPQV